VRLDKTIVPSVMEFNPAFHEDIALWVEFVISSVAKSQTCQVKGWTSLAKSIDAGFLPFVL
jgi:hypothetical protein